MLVLALPIKRTVAGAEFAECAALNERLVLPMVGLCKSFGDDGICVVDLRGCGEVDQFESVSKFKSSWSICNLFLYTRNVNDYKDNKFVF